MSKGTGMGVKIFDRWSCQGPKGNLKWWDETRRKIE